MPSPNDNQVPSLERAIVLIEEALAILDGLGLSLVAAHLSRALDSARQAQSDPGGR